MTAGDRRALHAQQNKENRAKYPAPNRALSLRAVGALRLMFAVTACTLLGVAAASAQPEVIRCLPPEAPMTELPVEVLAEYRTEIATEFEAYFAACGSAWNKDPCVGVIGVQSGPP